MDIYIFMCEKATELQKLWRPNYGHWYSPDGHEAQVICYPDTLTWCEDKNATGLFSQGQLQWMLQDEYRLKLAGNYQMFYQFLRFIDDIKFNEYSRRQLWLMFVMMKKYNKCWNARIEDWVTVIKREVSNV